MFQRTVTSTLAGLLFSSLTESRAIIHHESTLSNGITISHVRPQAFAPPSMDTVTDTWANLTRKQESKTHSKAAQLMRMVNVDVPTALLDGSDGASYTLPITWHGQEYTVVLDTGSADTWLVSSNFTCIDPYTIEPVEQSVCEFGARYNGPFNNITDLAFYTSYASGEYIYGSIVTVAMAVAGLEVTEQMVGLAEETLWFGSGSTANPASGLRTKLRILMRMYGSTNVIQLGWHTLH